MKIICMECGSELLFDGEITENFNVSVDHYENVYIECLNCKKEIKIYKGYLGGE